VQLDIDEAALNAHVLRMVAWRNTALRSIARELGLPPPLLSEADRMADLKAQAVAPESCGPDMPMAPARGKLVAVKPMAMQMGEEGPVPVHTGWRGRDAARALDVWDTMARQARRAGGADPFTAAQVAAGRAYGALVERHEARGLRGVSVETMMAGRGGPGVGGLSEAVLKEGRRLDALRRAIGDGLALEVQRVSRRARGVLTVRALVDGICVEGLAIGPQLRRAGWSDRKTDVLAAARDAVARALDRMGLVPPP
jgi:hypothetical protein